MSDSQTSRTDRGTIVGVFEHDNFLRECEGCGNLYDMLVNHRGCPKCAARGELRD